MISGIVQYFKKKFNAGWVESIVAVWMLAMTLVYMYWILVMHQESLFIAGCTAAYVVLIQGLIKGVQ